jgi:hypothetical protein
MHGCHFNQTEIFLQDILNNANILLLTGELALQPADLYTW